MLKSRINIVPCLWYDTQAEEAAAYYVDVFPDSRINKTTYFTEVGFEHHGKPAGSVLTVEFELDGQAMSALNGGPQFVFNEAVSLQIMCDTQQQVDHFWNALTAGGDPRAQQCGWLKDKFGVSWQVVPNRLVELLDLPDKAAADRVMAAMLEMKKLDIASLEAAAL